MRSWFRTWICVAVTVASLTVPAVAVAAESAGATNGDAASTQRRSRVDAAVQAVMKKVQIPGVILGVWQRGQARSSRPTAPATSISPPVSAASR
jgi:CubicO group peptidase (beta-lactamase class C family)